MHTAVSKMNKQLTLTQLFRYGCHSCCCCSPLLVLRWYLNRLIIACLNLLVVLALSATKKKKMWKVHQLQTKKKLFCKGIFGYLNILIRCCLLHLSAIDSMAERINYSNLEKKNVKKVIIQNHCNRWTSGAYFVHFQYFQGQSLLKVFIVILKMTLIYFTLPPPN